MVCQGLEIMGTGFEIIDFIIYPTTCFYYFYAVILFGLFIAITFLLHNREREIILKADLISSAGVSATAILFLALILTLIKNTSGIPALQQDIFLYVIAVWVTLMAVWFFKK